MQSCVDIFTDFYVSEKLGYVIVMAYRKFYALYILDYFKTRQKKTKKKIRLNMQFCVHMIYICEKLGFMHCSKEYLIISKHKADNQQTKIRL